MEEILKLKENVKKINAALKSKGLSESIKFKLRNKLHIEERNLQFQETNYLFDKFLKKELDAINLIINELFIDDYHKNGKMSFPSDYWPFSIAICYITYVEKHWLIKVQIGKYENIRVPTEPTSEMSVFSCREFFLKYKKSRSIFIKIKLDAYPEYPDQYNWKKILYKEIPGYNPMLLD